MEIIIGLIIIVLCCLVIWRASDGFEVAADYLGRDLSDGVRGATLNAIGSSMPELFTTLFFFFYYFYFLDEPLRANDGFAGGIGTTAGSAIFNGMIIPALVIMVVIYKGKTRRVPVSRKVILRDGISLILAEIGLIFLISGTTLYYWHGLILMGMYFVYITVVFRTMTKDATPEVHAAEDYYQNDGNGNMLLQVISLDLAPIFVKKEIKRGSAWSLLIFSMLIIGLACFFLVYACELSADAMGINTYFVAVILASAATSVPDTILSYRDAMRGEYDDAVANALGSNIFDVCFALGFPLFIFTAIHGPLEMNPAVVDDITELRVLLVFFTFAAFIVYIIGPTLGKARAGSLFLLYGIFTFYIFSKAYELEWAVQLGKVIRGVLGG
ncbi:pseudouridine synthase [Lewinellaceae bacterium SD302]|nr:pseudouridine synthase [Lewinellaceae bacterium SD302]